ncbi:hypothetical protein K3G39_10805 [Pontibacter sp. HSC-14F20]|uniref:hypothetical protein n=1 Tax=Pontibacter sp. HSC-14F20 TaxID=2864136 RepID=UPI001C73A392|nr:hypothetical protein [Pontibacter sp. HSC-14F20]MBX0333726.1 hypothetical protein [Pontibacter sp. HSC-14F20]
MIRHISIILALALLSSCTYKPKDKLLADFKNNDSKIVNTFYKIDNDTIFFERLLSSKSELILQSGKVFRGEHYHTNQVINSSRRLAYTYTTVDSLTTYFISQGLSAKAADSQSVLFVQIVPDTAMDNIDVFKFLNLRYQIEDKIDKSLRNEMLGEWVAGDLGVGANMLFHVNDWDKATELVLEILKEEELIDHVLVTKRIMISEEEWDYEIIYPVEYQGIFNSM